jgi:hypothetical protein
MEETVNKPKTKSNGQIFKETHGYSKSTKRAMAKSGISNFEEYKLVRKARKKSQRDVWRKKHFASLSQRKNNSKPKSSGGKDKAKDKESKK